MQAIFLFHFQEHLTFTIPKQRICYSTDLSWNQMYTMFTLISHIIMLERYLDSDLIHGNCKY